MRLVVVVGEHLAVLVVELRAAEDPAEDHDQVDHDPRDDAEVTRRRDGGSGERDAHHRGDQAHEGDDDQAGEIHRSFLSLFSKKRTLLPKGFLHVHAFYENYETTVAR